MSDYSIYPKAIDGYAQIPLAVDKLSPVSAEGVNRLRSGIINIEKAIGIAPHYSSSFGEFSTLTERFDNLENPQKLLLRFPNVVFLTKTFKP